MQRFLSIAIACSCLAWAEPARAQLSSTGATLFDLQPVLSGSVSGLNYHLAIETTGTSNRISLSELSKAVLAASTLTGSTGIDVNTATGVILNTGVTSLTGPTDHFLLSAVAGNITISLPQSISTTASPTFAGLTVNGAITSTGSILADSLTLTNGLSSSTASVTTGTIGTATSTTQVVLGRMFLLAPNGASVFASASLISLSSFSGVTLTGGVAATMSAPRVTASNWLRATGTASVDGASTFGGLMTVNNDVTSTGTITGVTLTGGTINGSAGSFSTLSGATITPTTLNVLGNSTFTGTSALLGLVGVAGQPTTTAALHIRPSGNVSGTYTWGLAVDSPTTGTNKNSLYVDGFASFGVPDASTANRVTVSGQINAQRYAISSQSVITFTSNVVQVGNHSGWVGSSLFAGSTEMLRATATGLVTGTTTGNASAQFQVESTTRGFLMPRMTTTQRDAIATPATGLMLWNTTTGTVNFYNGSAWVP